MISDASSIAAYMRDLGLAMLGDAVRHATFAASAPFADTIAIFRVAHAVEILIKARLIEHNILTVFPAAQLTGNLAASDLAVSTLSYAELPGLLQAATGYELSNQIAYSKIGELNVTLQYHDSGGETLSDFVLMFVFTTVEPLISEIWGESIFLHVNQAGDEADLYLRERLDDLHIPYSFPSHNSDSH